MCPIVNNGHAPTSGLVFSYKVQYIVGFRLVKMAISTNPQPTIYRLNINLMMLNIQGRRQDCCAVVVVSEVSNLWWSGGIPSPTTGCLSCCIISSHIALVCYWWVTNENAPSPPPLRYKKCFFWSIYFKGTCENKVLKYTEMSKQLLEHWKIQVHHTYPR